MKCVCNIILLIVVLNIKNIVFVYYFFVFLIMLYVIKFDLNARVMRSRVTISRIILYYWRGLVNIMGYGF